MRGVLNPNSRDLTLGWKKQATHKRSFFFNF
jgi:hypothetical protein